MTHSRPARIWFVGTLSTAAALVVAWTVWIFAVPAWHEHRIVRALKAVNAHADIRVNGHNISAMGRYDLDDFKGEEFQGRSAAIALAKVVLDERRDPPLRWLASMVLYTSDYDEPAAIPILMDALYGNDETGRYCSSSAFRGFGKSAVPAVIRALKHENPHVRRCAADALGNIGHDAADAVPALTEMVQRGHWLTRLAAAAALGKIGPEARSAVPAITDLLAETTIHDEALDDHWTPVGLREEMFAAFEKHAQVALKRLTE